MGGSKFPPNCSNGLLRIFNERPVIHGVEPNWSSIVPVRVIQRDAEDHVRIRAVVDSSRHSSIRSGANHIHIDDDLGSGEKSSCAWFVNTVMLPGAAPGESTPPDPITSRDQ
jgi:hypothetical protein